MSFAGMAGMRATIDDVSVLLGSLDDGEWNTPSAAARWTVKDVATHLPDLLNILVTAVQGVLDTDLGIESLNDARVAAKSSWSPAQVLDDLARQSAVALPMFEGPQAEPSASTEVQHLDLGSYPESFIPDMFAFDFYTLLRWDILVPLGPLHHDVTAPDEVRLKPAVGWLLAGLPQMQAGIRDSLAQASHARAHRPGRRHLDPRSRRQADHGECRGPGCPGGSRHPVHLTRVHRLGHHTPALARPHRRDG
jgi:uncharacterized protein (TIGR03083 family)